MPSHFQVGMGFHIIYDPHKAEIAVTLILHQFFIDRPEISAAPLAAERLKDDEMLIQDRMCQAVKPEFQPFFQKSFCLIR